METTLTDHDDAATGMVRGTVVKLDRKFPLVMLEDGTRLRCELATTLKKGREEEEAKTPKRSRGRSSKRPDKPSKQRNEKADRSRITIGDEVDVRIPEGHDVGVIEAISPRKSVFLRRDPVDRAISQALAANFDRVVIIHPIDRLNMKRLERELVLAHASGADVVVALSKSDLVDEAEAEQRIGNARDLAGSIVDVVAISMDDPGSIEQLRGLMGAGSVSILIGSSGAGKSTLVNRLVGDEVRATSEVRGSDGKGRHKTVSREMLEIASTVDDVPCGDMGMNVEDAGPMWIVDMPGVRGLGLWDSEEGLEAAFQDVIGFAEGCRFRDCKHIDEPGCAVREAIGSGDISEKRLESYLSMKAELEEMDRRREQASWR